MENLLQKLIESSVPFDEAEPALEVAVEVLGPDERPALTPEELENPEKIIQKLDLHWLHGSEKFFRRDGDKYIQLTIAGFRRFLVNLGVGKKTQPGDFNAVLEKVITRLESRHYAVEWAGNLAGHSAGVREVSGKRILVRQGPDLIAPKKGDWGTIRTLLETPLNVPIYGADQLTVTYGWLKVACLGFYEKKLRFGQAFTMIGPHDSFKSSIQDFLFTPLFGGRQGDPGAFMLDGEKFNADLAGAEHLALQDCETGHRADAREKTGERIKKFCVQNLQRIRGMHSEGLPLDPFQRLSISANDSPDRARVLPAMSRDLADKFILLATQKTTMPFPLYTDEQRHEFRQRLRNELPAFAHHLLYEFEIPENWRSNRFGVRHWHNPIILGILNETEDLVALWDNIQRQLFGSFRVAGLDPNKFGEDGGECWRGTAGQLEARLTRVGQLADYELQDQAKQIAKSPTVLGKQLQRLHETDSAKVGKPPRTADARGWVIFKDKTESEGTVDEPF